LFFVVHIVINYFFLQINIQQ